MDQTAWFKIGDQSRKSAAHAAVVAARAGAATSHSAVRPRRCGRIQFCFRRDPASGRDKVALSASVVDDMALLPLENMPGSRIGKSKECAVGFSAQR
jgi:hypothetical protein